MEHHANIVPWQMIAESTGAEIVVVPVLQDGSLNRKAWTNCLIIPEHPSYRFVTFPMLGTQNPIKEIVNEAHKNGVKVIIDGAQSVPHLKVNLRDIDCDFFVFSGHKLFAPMGIGLLCQR